MKYLALAFFLITSALTAATVRKEVACPTCKLEACRWEARVQKVAENHVRVDWDKSVITYHVEKPKAEPIHCNVDRNFNDEKQGYLRVWFKGEEAYCEVGPASDPSLCGVSFLFHTKEEMKFPTGFEVKAPQGKDLVKVEHLSTLHVQCGDFSKENGFTNAAWDAVLGWSRAESGDGTYAKEVSLY